MDTQVIIRNLRHEDYADVLKISQEIWDGHDYLPKVFHEWVDSPGLFLGIECISRKEIIGVAHVAILPDHSAWLEGLRIRSDFRGQGLSRKIMAVQMEYALEKLNSGIVERIASTTFIDNVTSQHLSLTNGFTCKDSYLVLSANPEEKSREPLQIEPWDPTWEEVSSLSYFKETGGHIIQFFVVQKLCQSWWDQSKSSFRFYKVNGARGWIDYGHEPHCVILDPSREAIVNWLEYASTVFQEPASTIIYPKPDRVQELKTTKLCPWSHWAPDCLYFVYDP